MGLDDPPRPRGRPPIDPPSRRRTVLVHTRLTPDEADRAYRFSIRTGRPLAVLLRDGIRRIITPSDS